MGEGDQAVKGGVESSIRTYMWNYFKISPDSKWNSLTFLWPWEILLSLTNFLTCGNHAKLTPPPFFHTSSEEQNFEENISREFWGSKPLMKIVGKKANVKEIRTMKNLVSIIVYLTSCISATLLYSQKLKKTLSSCIIHLLRGEYCWIIKERTNQIA